MGFFGDGEGVGDDVVGLEPEPDPGGESHHPEWAKSAAMKDNRKIGAIIKKGFLSIVATTSF
jgi:hypothetical protein